MLLIIWTITGFLTYGWFVGYSCTNYPYAKHQLSTDRFLGALLGLMGPVGLTATAISFIVATPLVKRFCFKL